MDNEIEMIGALDRKITQLINLYENEKKNALLLRKKILALEEQIKSLTTDNKMLRETNNQLRLVTALKSKEDTSNVERFIDELVREIDECITLLIGENNE
jgi:hypothetical protein